MLLYRDARDILKKKDSMCDIKVSCAFPEIQICDVVASFLRWMFPKLLIILISFVD